jgi:hypothetical protein
MENRKRSVRTGWFVSGVLLLLINVVVALAVRSNQSAQLSGTQPGFWAGSILLIGGALVLDVIWVGLLILWLSRRHLEISEREHLVHPPSEHPHEDPKTQDKLTN